MNRVMYGMLFASAHIASAVCAITAVSSIPPK